MAGREDIGIGRHTGVEEWGYLEEKCHSLDEVTPLKLKVLFNARCATNRAPMLLVGNPGRLKGQGDNLDEAMKTSLENVCRL